MSVVINGNNQAITMVVIETTTTAHGILIVVTLRFTVYCDISPSNNYRYNYMVYTCCSTSYST